MFDVAPKARQHPGGVPDHRRPPSSALSSTRPSVGNQALQHHLRAQRLRAKLTVGGANDSQEAEADQTADQIMSGVAGPCACGGTCSSCRGGGNTLRRKPAAAGNAAAPNVRGDAFGPNPGRPLDAGSRSFFEPHFGDLSAVRVHDTKDAAATADAIGARAYTTGADIGFAQGEYVPGSSEGKKLLAHELAHVAQGGAIMRRQPNYKKAPSPILGPPKPISLMMDPSEMCGPNGCFTDDDIKALGETPSDPWDVPTTKTAPAQTQPDEENGESEDQTSAQSVAIGPFLAVAMTAKGPTPAPTPAPVPTNTRRIVEGAPNDASVTRGASLMGGKIKETPTTFGKGALAGADEVSIIAHGNYGYARIGTAKFSAKQLADELVASGWTGGTVRLVICKSGLCGTLPSSLGQELANELAALGADSAVIAPAGNVNLGRGGGLPKVRADGATQYSPRGWDWEIYTAEAPKEPSFFSFKAWKGAGVGAVKTGALIALSILHSKAVVDRMQKQAQETGYAPIGPTGNKLYDIGSWILDPTNEAGHSVPFSQRFHMAQWRQTIKDAADAKAPGDIYRFPWETDNGWDALREHRKTKTCYVSYRKKPNGYWLPISGSCDEDDFYPPDLNEVIDPNVSDEEVRKYLELPPEHSDFDGGLV